MKLGLRMSYIHLEVFKLLENFSVILVQSVQFR